MTCEFQATALNAEGSIDPVPREVDNHARI